MIDYDKLRLAHDLVIKSDKYSFKVGFGKYTGSNSLEINLYDFDEFIAEFRNPDDLLEKLKELNKQKYKYEVGNKVFHLLDEEIEEVTILEVDDTSYKVDNMFYRIYSGWWTEEQLYPSRESLIKAQIEYWQSLLPLTESCSESIRKHHELEGDCEH